MNQGHAHCRLSCCAHQNARGIQMAPVGHHTFGLLTDLKSALTRNKFMRPASRRTALLTRATAACAYCFIAHNVGLRHFLWAIWILMQCWFPTGADAFRCLLEQMALTISSVLFQGVHVALELAFENLQWCQSNSYLV